MQEKVPATTTLRDLGRRELLWDTCEERVLLDAAPDVSVNAPGEGMANEDVALSVTFANAGDDTGYGPYVDLLAEQGVEFNDDATYQGAPVATELVGVWNAGRFEDAGGNEVAEHPLTGEPIDAGLTAGREEGDALYALTLPFGSFVPDQPAATVDFTATLAGAVGAPLDVEARGGFMFGDATPLNDPDSDPRVLGAFDAAAVTPVVLRLDKAAAYPEQEPATGANFPVAYTVTVDVADGETVTGLTLADLLPAEMRFVPGSASAGTIDGQSLTADVGTLLGTAADDDYTLTYSAYVDDVIADDDGHANDDLVLGEDATATYGHDAAAGLTATARDDVTAKLIAAQKSVRLAVDPGGEGVSAGDTLEWTIRFQVSDFTAAADVVFDDVFTDGQEFDDSFAPTYSVLRNGDAASGTFAPSTSAGNFVYDLRAGGPDGGKTFVTIDLSQQLIDDGQLGGTGVLAGDDHADGVHGQGGTIGTITFRTRILEDFRERFPSGDPSVDAGDVLGNNVTVRAVTAGGDREADGSAASATVVGPTFDKRIHAINGSTIWTDTAVQPGQTVTYRLRGTIPAADVEDLVFADYLPLPVFDATDPDADGTASGWTFVAGGGLPGAGEIRFGPLHNLGDLTYDGGTPTDPSDAGFLSVDPDANKLVLDFGTFDVVGAQTAEVDVLLTVAATDKPFADGLFLTNQAEFTYGDTSATSSAATEIVQIRLDMPELELTKSVGDIGGAGSIDADGNATGIDAGDVVTFRVEVSNTGGGDAFDLALTDAIPAGFRLPDGGPNYRVTDVDGDARAGFAGDLLAGTFGHAANQSGPSIASGGTLVIEYDLVVADAAEAGATYGQAVEARIVRYAASDGGNDYTFGNTGPWQDDATAALAAPTVAVAVTADDHAGTSGTDLAVGEIATYTATVTVPEGVTPELVLTDALPKGMAFVDVLDVSAPAAVVVSDLRDGPGIRGATGYDTGRLRVGGHALASDKNDARIDGDYVEFTVAAKNGRSLDLSELKFKGYNGGVGRVSVTSSADGHAAWLLDDQPVSGGGGSTKTVTLGGSHAGLDAVTFRIYPHGDGAAPAQSDDFYLDDVRLLGDVGDGNGAGEIVRYDFGGNARAASAVPANAGRASGLAFGPAHRYALDGDANDSAGLLHGTPAGGVTYGEGAPLAIGGVGGGSAKFGGAGRIDLPARELGDAFTIAAWVRPAAGVGEQVVLANADQSDDGFRLTLGEDGTDDGRLRFEVGDGANTADVTTAAGAVVYGQWNHVAAVVDRAAGTVTLFVNGVDATTDATLDVASFGTAYPLAAGAARDGGNALVGGLDDLRIYDRAASADELATLADPFGGVGGNSVDEDRTLRLALGTVDNAARGEAAETLTVTYRAAAINSADNHNNDQRKNDAAVAWSGDGAADADANRPGLRVREPRLSLSTSADRANADAGDTVTFTVRVSHVSHPNNAVDSDANAYDLTVAEAVPSGMTYVAGSLAATAASVTFDSLAEEDGAVAATVGLLALDAQVAEFTFQATVDAAAPAGSTFTTDGDLTWTSLPDDATTTRSPGNPYAVERTGDPATPAESAATNDYRRSSAATVDFVAPTAATTLIATSETDTAGADVAVGEIVRYALDVVVPEGSMPDARLLATLPDGLEMIDLAQIKLTLVGDFTTEPGLVDAADTVDPARIADNGDGTITFDLGDLVNDDSDPDAETLRLAFNALVLNAAENNAGDAKQALFDFRVDGMPLVTSDPAALTVVEPRIANVEKRLLNAPRDAGDAAEFRVTFTNTGTATAHDVRLVDPLHEHLALSPADVAVTGTKGATGTAAIAPDGTLTIALVAVQPGEAVTIDYVPTLRESARPDLTLTSTARVDYTSLAGGGADASNPSGTSAGPERDGSGGIDDYADADAAGFTTATPSFEQAVIATGLADAAVLTPLDELAVGETVTFRLTATLTEGTTPRVVLHEQLPVLDAGVLEALSATVVAGFGGNLSGDGFDAGPTPAFQDTDGDGLADRMTLDFGSDVLNAADNSVTDADRIAVDVVARLVDAPENVPDGRAGVVREWWTGINGTDLPDLTGNGRYPDSPDGRDVLADFEANDWDDQARHSNWGDKYGQRVRGYLVPPTTGEYTLVLGSDGHGSLRVSTDEDPANAAEVASVPDWVNPQEWDRHPQQRSEPLTLEAGRRYYVEALHKEHTGGDNLAVGWLRPGVADDVANIEVVPGSALRPLFVPLDAVGSLDYGTATVVASSSVETVEPVLSLAQMADRASADAGDLVRFTLEVAHGASSHADAYDLVLGDLLGPNLDLVAGSVTSSLGDAIIITGNGTDDSTVRVDVPRLALGQTLTIAYDAVPTDAVRPGDAVAGNATLDYDSHPDAALGRAAARSSSASVAISDVPTLATSVTTSLDQTVGRQVAVGEVITFELAAEVPEGTLDTLELDHLLPDGLTPVGAEVVAIAGLKNAALGVGDAGTIDGRSIRFDFGDGVINVGDNDDANDLVTVRVSARVDDVPESTDGETLTSASTLNWGTGTAIMSDTVTIVEPALTLGQSRDLASGDAGDVVTYTVTIANGGSAAGHLTAFTDTLHPDLDLIPNSVITTAGTITSSSGIVAVDLGVVTAGAGPITIEYQAKLADSVTPGDTPTTAAGLAWSSAPSDGRPGSASASTTVVATGGTMLARTATLTSLAHTGPGKLTFGETFTLEHKATLPEGTLPRLRFDAAVSADLAEIVAAEVVGVGGNVLATATPVLTDTSGDGHNDIVVFDFGSDVTNRGDNAVDAGDTVTLRLVARALDVPANSTGGEIAATLTMDDGLAIVSDAATFTLVEPALSVSQTRTPASGDAGDEVRFTVSIANVGGTSDARAVVLTDILDPNLRLVPGSVTATAGSATSDGRSVRVDLAELPRAAGPVMVEYRAIIADDATPGDVLAATAELAYASAATGGRAYMASAGTTIDVVGAATVATSAATSLPATTDSEHRPINADVAVGETVTFTDTIVLPEGKLPRLIVTRSLPMAAGYDPMVFESAAVVAGPLSAAPVYDDVDGDGVFDRVTFDFGTDVTIPGNNQPGDDAVTFETVARVADAPAAVDGALLAARVDVDDGLAGTAAQAEFDVVQPDLAITNSVDKANAEIDEVVTFTIEIEHKAGSTATAYGAVVVDPMLGHPALDKLDLIEGSVEVVSGPGTVSLGDDAGEPTLRVELATFAPDERTVVRYQAKANGFASALGDTITGDATLGYESAPELPRLLAATDGAAFETNPTGIAAVAASVIDTDLPATPTTHAAVGEVVTFEVVGLIPAGSYPQDVVFEFDAPDGLTLLGGEVARIGGNLTATAGDGVISGDSLSLALADVRSDPGGAAADHEVAVRVVARVANVPGVAEDAALTAEARLVNGAAVLHHAADVTVAEPALDVRMTASDPTPHLGDTITYSLTVDPAIGGAAAYDGRVTVDLPPGLTSGGESRLSFDLPTLAPADAPLTITFDADVTADPAAWGDDVTPRAEVRYFSAPADSDPRRYDATLSMPTEIVGPDLRVTIDDGEQVRATGETWTQTATITNLDHPSGDIAGDVVATVTLPAGVAFAGSDSPFLDAASGNVVTFRLPALAVGAAEALAFQVRSDRPAPVAVRDLAFDATVAHADVEPTPADNVDRDVDLLDAAPDLVTTVTADRPEAENGQVVTYTISVTNDGDQPATGVTLAADVPDVALDLVVGQATEWTVPQLDAGETRTFTLAATIKSGIVAGVEDFAVTASVADDAANGPDRDAADNLGSATVLLVSEPNLSVTPALFVNGVPADAVEPGDAVRYDLTVANSGGQEATGVTVTQTVPTDVILLTDWGDATVDAEAGTVTWTIASLPAHSTVALSLAGEVAFPPPPGVQEFRTTSAVADDGSNGPDRDPADNAFALRTDLDAFVYDATINAARTGAAATTPVADATPVAGYGQVGRLFSDSSWRPAVALASEPIYAGSAAPGSSVTVAVYDDAGRQVGSRTVTADSGGQWHASLPADSYGGSGPGDARAGLRVEGSRLFASGGGLSPSAGLFGPVSRAGVTVGTPLRDAPHDVVATQAAPAAHLLGGGAARPTFNSAVHSGLSVRRAFEVDLSGGGERVKGDAEALRNPFALAAARRAA